MSRRTSKPQNVVKRLSLTLSDTLSIFEKKKTFDIDLYNIQYDSVYTVPEMSKIFFQHLKKEFNSDSFHFLQEIKKYKDLKSEKEIVEKFFEIFYNFIETGSPKEINIEQKKKKKFKKETEIQFKNKDKLILKDPKTIFDAFYVAVYDLLKYDCFPRFIRTPECISTVQSFINDPRVLKLIPSDEFPYTDESFRETYVTEFDIKFSKRICQDTFDWILLHTEQNDQMNTFHLSQNLFPQVSLFEDGRMIKFEGTLPAGVEECFLALGTCKGIEEVDCNISYIGELENMTFQELQSLDKNTKTKRGNSIIEVFAEFGKMYKTRYHQTCTTVIYNHDDKGSIMRISKPYTKNYPIENDIEKTFSKTFQENQSKIEKNCYYFPSFTVFNLKRLSSDLTHYTYIISKTRSIDSISSLFSGWHVHDEVD
jgi:hypothetical protein